ncbi:competence protein CoiA [Carnobacterium sp.]|uniref:competence protein CoiA n=1 Tax=Carnobacterium sp. TaxID=48221 RepID=UPI003C7165C0
MLIALNDKEELIHASKVEEKIQKKASFYCPDCKNSVFLKNGKLKIAHFSHFNQTNCLAFSEGETKEHLQGKQLLLDWFVKQGFVCQLEAHLPDLNQRPDILVWINQTKAIAVEFQCSPLPVKRMQERTEGYKTKGYEVFWIVGSQFKLTDRVTAFQRLFIYSNAYIRRSLFFLDVPNKKFFVYSNIDYQNLTQEIEYDRVTIKLNQLMLSNVSSVVKELANKNRIRKNRIVPQPKELIKSHDYLNQGRMYRNPEMVSFQKYIYQRGDSLISLPIEVYFKVQGQLLIRTLPHFWKYILLKWLTNKYIGSIINLKELDNQLNKMLVDKTVIFYTMPLLTIEEQKKPFYEYVKLLVTVDILMETKTNQWMLKRKPYYYKNEQEKISSFKNVHSLFN